MPAATYQDILNAPDDMIAEIIDGELQLSRRGRNVRSSRLQMHFMMQAKDIIYSLLRPEIHVGGHVLVPDQAGWWERPLPDEPDPEWEDFPLPLWVLEYRGGRRLEIWRESGIPHLWFLDIERKTLDADGKVFGFEGEIRAAPFEERPFTLKAFWS